MTKEKTVGYRLAKDEFSFLSAAIGARKIIGLAPIDKVLADDLVKWSLIKNQLAEKKAIRVVDAYTVELDAITKLLVETCCHPTLIIASSIGDYATSSINNLYFGANLIVQLMQDPYNSNNWILTPYQTTESLLSDLCSQDGSMVAHVELQTEIYLPPIACRQLLAVASDANRHENIKTVLQPYCSAADTIEAITTILSGSKSDITYTAGKYDGEKLTPLGTMTVKRIQEDEWYLSTLPDKDQISITAYKNNCEAVRAYFKEITTIGLPIKKQKDGVFID